jgi:hypothetical protein
VSNGGEKRACLANPAGQEELCEQFWDRDAPVLEPLRHFLHEARDLYPAVCMVLPPTPCVAAGLHR